MKGMRTLLNLVEDKRIENPEDGLSATIADRDDRWSVVIYDEDSEQTITVRYFPKDRFTVDDAEEWARKTIFGDGTLGSVPI